MPGVVLVLHHRCWHAEFTEGVVLQTVSWSPLNADLASHRQLWRADP